MQNSETPTQPFKQCI